MEHSILTLDIQPRILVLKSVVAILGGFQRYFAILSDFQAFLREFRHHGRFGGSNGVA